MTICLHLTGSTCPVQYTNYAGDVPGWGSIQSLLSINNDTSCAKHCDLTSGCCSFEYSPTERRCNLNRECKPTRAEVHKNYTFCVKGIFQQFQHCNRQNDLSTVHTSHTNDMWMGQNNESTFQSRTIWSTAPLSPIRTTLTTQTTLTGRPGLPR